MTSSYKTENRSSIFSCNASFQHLITIQTQYSQCLLTTNLVCCFQIGLFFPLVFHRQICRFMLNILILRSTLKAEKVAELWLFKTNYHFTLKLSVLILSVSFDRPPTSRISRLILTSKVLRWWDLRLGGEYETKAQSTFKLLTARRLGNVIFFYACDSLLSPCTDAFKASFRLHAENVEPSATFFQPLHCIFAQTLRACQKIVSWMSFMNLPERNLDTSPV